MSTKNVYGPLIPTMVRLLYYLQSVLFFLDQRFVLVSQTDFVSQIFVNGVLYIFFLTILHI